jgi:hypothetical protein
MTAEQFTYWLQGFMELTTMNHLSTTQFQIVKDHLDLVFEKQTPNRLTSMPGNGTTQPYPGPMTTGPYTSPLQPTTNPYTNPLTNPNQVTCGDVSKGLIC